MAANGEEIRICLEGGKVPAPSNLSVNNNELTWTASGADEQTSYVFTFVGNVSKREVTAAARSTKVTIPANLAESRYLVEARAVRNGSYSPPTDGLKISMKASAPEDLIKDLETPQGIATDGKWLYIANNQKAGGKVIKTDMDGKNPVTVVDKLQNPTGVATDGKLLWVATQGSGGAVIGYNMSHNPYDQQIAPARGKPGINYLSYLDSSIDPPSGNIPYPVFFTSASKGWASAGYLDSQLREIVTDLKDARGMACDGKFIYIASWDRNTVIRASVDGKVKEDFITVNKPEDISYNESHLYVTTDNDMLIRASRLTGAVDDSFTISRRIKPRGVVVWGNYVYFVEQAANRVSRVLLGWAAE